VLPMVAFRLMLWGMFPHARPVITDWANRMVLLPVFIYGFILAGDPGLVRAVDRQWKLMLAVGLVFSGAMFAWAWPGDLTQRFPMPFSADYVWFWSTYAVGGLVWPIAMIGAARAVNTGRSRVLERARELMNPFYMLHQPVVVLLAFALLDDRAGAIASFFRLLITAFVTTVTVCLLVKRTRVTRVLFGFQTERLTHPGQCAPKL
jgi:glucan biosynthesis protein C